MSTNFAALLFVVEIPPWGEKMPTPERWREKLRRIERRREGGGSSEE